MDPTGGPFNRDVKNENKPKSSVTENIQRKKAHINIEAPSALYPLGSIEMQRMKTIKNETYICKERD